jgi:3-oxoacyl-[acyl-carrier protein] reductase
MGSLNGKVALVTGAGRGVGLALAKRFAADGAKLVINDLDEEPAAEAVSQLEAMGASVVSCVGSVSDDDFADRFIAAAVDNFGTIDIVVNNAGYTWDNVIQKMSDEQFQAMLDVHMVAPFRILRAAAPVFRGAAKAEAQDGRRTHRKVVNVSSIVGVVGGAGQSNYASAKAGMIGLTKTLAREWGRYNVNVNAVAFGHIDTRLTATYDDGGPTVVEIEGRQIGTGVPQWVVDAYVPSIPLGRVGTPEDAAGSVYILCLPEADYVSGQVLLVTGGSAE